MAGDDIKPEERPCDLCGLEIGEASFSLPTEEGDKCFCCDGCQCIYEMLHDDQIQQDSKEPMQN